MVRKLGISGQSTLEYAVVIAVIVGALLATQVYVKRGLQGRFKQSADDIGEQFSPGAGYYNTTVESNVTSFEKTDPGTAAAGGAPGAAARAKATVTDTNQTQNRTAEERVGEFGSTNEYWGK
ncbi:MAG TPA: hypothetical protein PKL77_00965 [Candidatus Omnitrophota bacterium]|nr:hypothetical protein [Candidatus Omnitrophota bacterium]